MTAPDHEDPYYNNAQSWAEDRNHALRTSRRVAWIMVAVLATIAVLEAFALLFLVPLKTVVPYTLLVDRQTGHVEALDPLNHATIAPDTALTRSLLAQYVAQRESFDIDSLNDSYRKVALWSGDEARTNYIASMQSSNPQSPLANLPRRALIQTQIRSVSPLSADTALVRFATIRSDPGQQAQTAQNWVSVIKYRFNTAAMSDEDRLLNPLGFQVVHYRRDAESAPEETHAPPAPETVAQPTALMNASDTAR